MGKNNSSAFLFVAFFVLLAIGLGLGISNHDDPVKKARGSSIPSQKKQQDIEENSLFSPMDNPHISDIEPIFPTFSQGSDAFLSGNNVTDNAKTTISWQKIDDPDQLQSNMMDSENISSNPLINPDKRDGTGRLLFDLLLIFEAQLPKNAPNSAKDLIKIAIESYKTGQYARAERIAQVLMEIHESTLFPEYGTMAKNGKLPQKNTIISPENAKAEIKEKMPLEDAIYDDSLISIADYQENAENTDILTYNGFYRENSRYIGILRKIRGNNQNTFRLSEGDEIPGMDGMKVFSISPSEIILMGKPGTPLRRIPRLSPGQNAAKKQVPP